MSVVVTGSLCSPNHFSEQGGSKHRPLWPAGKHSTTDYTPAHHWIFKLKRTLSLLNVHLQMRSLWSLEKDHSRRFFQKGVGRSESHARFLVLLGYSFLTPQPTFHTLVAMVMFGKNHVISFFLERNKLPRPTLGSWVPLTLRGWAFSSVPFFWIFDMFRPKSAFSTWALLTFSWRKRKTMRSQMWKQRRPRLWLPIPCGTHLSHVTSLLPWAHNPLQDNWIPWSFLPTPLVLSSNLCWSFSWFPLSLAL